MSKLQNEFPCKNKKIFLFSEVDSFKLSTIFVKSHVSFYVQRKLCEGNPISILAHGISKDEIRK